MFFKFSKFRVNLLLYLRYYIKSKLALTIDGNIIYIIRDGTTARKWYLD